jgi:hypothetical protein
MNAPHSCKMQTIKVYTSDVDIMEHHLALKTDYHDTRVLFHLKLTPLKK